MSAVIVDGRASKRSRSLITPEGVPLHVELAGLAARASAFAMDFAITLGVTWVLYVFALSFGGTAFAGVSLALAYFSALMLRLIYFVAFELLWSGVTPGKRAFGLRVIDRYGGPLSVDAIVARNLSREVEVFFPLTMLFASHSGALAFAVWLALTSLLPVFNRDDLRLGDLLGGTLVIDVPKRRLLPDLAAGNHRFTFDDLQLERYGIRELQVLEDVLRLADTPDSEKIQNEVAEKIQRRIGWSARVPWEQQRAFLEDFYAAQRAFLETRKHLGDERADKHFREREKLSNP
jgi:uncharacterized RDD family membrane protein YckC